MNLPYKIQSITSAAGRSKGKYRLAHLIMFCLGPSFAQTLFPRAASIGFKYAQTFLITAAVNHLQKPVISSDKNHAYGLVGATLLIYFGQTVN
jgi:ATP-binding cassette subfamily C (CFTR/MRP) protein 1